MKKIIISILFIILCLPTFGILEDKKVSLSNAIETVLSNNPQLKMSDIDIEIAKNTIKKENALKNPSIGTFQSIGKTAKGNAQEVGVDYVIEILKRGKRKNIAKIQSNIAQDDKNIQKINLVAEVKATYFTLLLKKTNLKLMDEQSKLSKETLDNIINDKSSLKTDIIQAKIAYNRSIMYRNIAKNEFISAQNDFNAIMNIKTVNYDTLEDSLTNDYSRFLTVDPENNSLTFEKIKEFALNNRYDIKKAKKAEYLVLQPMNSQDALRKWLSENGFSVLKEDIATEEYKVYNIILARKGTPVIYKNEFELHIPPYLYNNKYFYALRDKKKREFLKIKNGLEAAAAKNEELIESIPDF